MYVSSLWVGQACLSPFPPNISLLYMIRTLARYPRRNFGGNQLLDGSISLSPLFTSTMNELHVSNTQALSQSFPWRQLSQE